MKTHIYFLTDRSGSMNDIKGMTVDGFNTYLREMQQTRVEGVEIDFTLATFNTFGYGKPFGHLPIQNVEQMRPEDFRAVGGTPLIDAVWTALKEAIEVEDKYDRTIVVVQTDGYENSSQHHTQGQVKGLIAEKEGPTFQTVFIGSGLGEDAYREGGSIGFGYRNTISNPNTGAHTQSVMSNLAENTAAYASGVSTSMAWSNAQKREAGDQHEPDQKE